MTSLFHANPFSIFRPRHPVKIEGNDPQAIQKLKEAVTDVLRAHLQEGQTLVTLCIGTDRSTGDALGPIIGTALCKRIPDIPLYGTLDEPVHAVNLQEKLKEIADNNLNPFVLAIDASLGRLDSVGKIDVGPGSLHPGAGVNKSLPRVGDMYISGIVNVGGFLEYFVLQNTRLSIVMTLAEVITEGLHGVLSLSTQKEKAGVN